MTPEAYLEMARTEDVHWWFVGRRRIVASFIERMRLPTPARILEIGAGTGGNLDLLSRFGNVRALEMDEHARSIARQKTSGRIDIEFGRLPGEFPFRGEAFDLVCMFDVLEHIDDDAGTLEAVRDVLAPDGRLLLTVPAYQFLWGPHDEFLHHKRRYTASQLRARAAQAGLRVVRLSYFNMLLFPLALASRLVDRLSGAKAARGTSVPPASVNRLLAATFGAEQHLLDKVSLPFGVSLVAVLDAPR